MISECWPFLYPLHIIQPPLKCSASMWIRLPRTRELPDSTYLGKLPTLPRKHICKKEMATDKMVLSRGCRLIPQACELPMGTRPKTLERGATVNATLKGKILYVMTSPVTWVSLRYNAIIAWLSMSLECVCVCVCVCVCARARACVCVCVCVCVRERGSGRGA